MTEIAQIAVVIVGFRNADDIDDCLHALSKASHNPQFDVFICENGGADSYERLINRLICPDGPCTRRDNARDPPVDLELGARIPRTTELQSFRLRNCDANVWVTCAEGNLGYAGGVNVWLKALDRASGWKGVWILNPDTQPAPGALAALVERAEIGKKGMVGSTIVSSNSPSQVHCRGGLHWQRFLTRLVSIGFGDRINGTHNLAAIEAAMDCPSGATLYVTRECIEKIGPMDERFFLFYEDVDWGVRAKVYGLGYAHESIVIHKRGTTTGSGSGIREMPLSSVYLQHRNGLLFVRKHYFWTLPIRVTVSFIFALTYLLKRAPRAFGAAVMGISAGLKGQTGRPTTFDSITVKQSRDRR